MRGLMAKSLRETRRASLSFALGVGLVMSIITYVLPQIMVGLNEFMLQVPFVRSAIAAMMGVDVSAGLTTTMMLSVMWTHPVVLALIWAHGIVLGTRFPAGEIDGGTIDVLLGWPVSRRAVYAAETMVWVASSGGVVLAGFAGYLLATLSLPPDVRPALARAGVAAINLFALAFAAGAGAMAASSLVNRRGVALAMGFAFVAGSFLLNFLTPYWGPADAIGFVGLMEYYRPALILRDGGFPVRDVLVLVLVGGALWTIGLERTARRDIVTV